MGDGPRAVSAASNRVSSSNLALALAMKGHGDGQKNMDHYGCTLLADPLYYRAFDQGWGQITGMAALYLHFSLVR